jgi:hypothetical protein
VDFSDALVVVAARASRHAFCSEIFAPRLEEREREGIMLQDSCRREMEETMIGRAVLPLPETTDH